MLGRTANGIYWMTRYTERSENLARLLEAGLRMSLTRSDGTQAEWLSVLETAGATLAFEAEHGKTADGPSVVDFILRSANNPNSILNMMGNARTNARMVRTAITREVWETINECWLTLKARLARPVREQDVPKVLELVRRQSSRIRGAIHGTMLRNDIYNFARMGTFIERADNTARILDIKYYVLLPSVRHVGSSLDNVQWESILRSLSAHSSFRYIYGPDFTNSQIAEFLMFEMRLPRSLLFCQKKIMDNLDHLAKDYGERTPAHDANEALVERMKSATIERVFAEGLHEFLQDYLRDNNAIGHAIDRAYRFYE